MFITRQELESLNEADLRMKVLIPLFRAMAFQEVYHHHGGVLEQGKDIVMWKSEGLRGRVNYAVVVKAGDVRGSATGSDSAATVLTQVTQCFETPYRDPTSAEERRVHQCLVVTSGRIITEALYLLEGPLRGRGFGRSTVLIDGDRLCKLIEEHLPQNGAWERLQGAAATLQGLVPGHELSFRVDGDHTSITVLPKPGTPPLEVAFEEFPKTPAGDEARARLRGFVETGATLHLTSEMLAGFEPPALIKQLTGLKPGTPQELRLSRHPSAPQRMRLEWMCDDGERAALPDVEFIAVRGGTEEITLSNEHQNTPWKIRLRMERSTLRGDFQFHARLGGHNVGQVLRWLRFQNAASKPGSIHFRTLADGSETTAVVGSPGLEAPPRGLVKLVEMLVFIQERTDTLITYPEDISDQQIGDIVDVYHFLKGGKVTVDSIALECDRQGARWHLERFAIPATYELPETPGGRRSVLDAEIDLGPGRVFSKAAFIPPADLEEIRSVLERSNPPEVVNVKVVAASPESPLELSFPRWQPLSNESGRVAPPA